MARGRVNSCHQRLSTVFVRSWAYLCQDNSCYETRTSRPYVILVTDKTAQVIVCHLLVLSHEFHSHWLFHFLPGLERNPLSIARPELDGHLLPNRVMCSKLYFVLSIICHESTAPSLGSRQEPRVVTDDEIHYNEYPAVCQLTSVRSYSLVIDSRVRTLTRGHEWQRWASASS